MKMAARSWSILRQLTWVTLACFSLPINAQTLVDVTWLAQHLDDPELTVLHVGDAEGFAKVHIPSARHITVADISQPRTADPSVIADPAVRSTELLFEAAAPDRLRSAFEMRGISNDSRIVLYAGAEERLPAVTRVAHMLNYIGLGENTSVLNGGLNAWLAAGNAPSSEISPAARGRLSLNINAELIVDAEFVRSLPERPEYKLVDARAAVNYSGESPTFDRAGHIPGAISIPFSQMNDASLRFDRERIAAEFEAAGIMPSDKLVVYCHVGMQATEVIFAARMLGYEAVLYDGSFQDWAINDRGPVERD